MEAIEVRSRQKSGRVSGWRSVHPALQRDVASIFMDVDVVEVTFKMSDGSFADFRRAGEEKR